MANLYSRGVTKVSHFKKNDNSFLSYNEFLIKYPGIRTNFLQYLSIINAMPANYKRPTLGVDKKNQPLRFT